MKNIFSIILLFSFGSVLQAQDYQGTVLDKASKEPVSYAQVFFVDLKTGTSTDLAGNFDIKDFNQKSIHIQITSLGYNLLDTIVNMELGEKDFFYLTESHIKLEEVVISAPQGKLQGDNIVSITHRKFTELQQTNPTTLSEAISNIPGVDQATTGAGIGKPVIRGLTGNRIVTYSQGIRVENQQWGNEHGLGVGSVGIESVEVIKGPASLLYGADALGGVLFFIDERYAQQNTLEGFAQTKFLSNTLGSITNVGVKINKGKLKFNIFGNYSLHSDYQTPNLERLYNSRFGEKNLKSSIGFTHKNWISNIRYSYLNTSYGIIKKDSSTVATQKNHILPFKTIDDHKVSFENIFFAKKSKFNITLGHTNNYRQVFKTSDSRPIVGLSLNTSTYNIKWYSPNYRERFSFIIGSQGMLQTNRNKEEHIFIPDAETRDLGTFIIANININKFQLQGGIRGDIRKINTKHMETDHGNIPSFDNVYQGITFSGGGVYKIKQIKLRANMSSGLRAPNTTELLSDGEHHGANQYIKGNQQLKNENATQMDFTIDYENEHISFSVNPFYNNINNYIFLSPTGSQIEDVPVFQYKQKNAHLYGGELGVHLHPHKFHWLHLESNLSTVYAEDKQGNPLPLIPQNKVKSTVRIEFSNQKKIQLKNVFVQHIHKFKQSRIDFSETESEKYSLINLGLKVHIKTKNNPIEITTGINNLLNTEYIDHLSLLKSLEIPNQGINYHISIKIPLAKNMK